MNLVHFIAAWWTLNLDNGSYNNNTAILTVSSCPLEAQGKDVNFLYPALGVKLRRAAGESKVQSVTEVTRLVCPVYTSTSVALELWGGKHDAGETRQRN